MRGTVSDSQRPFYVMSHDRISLRGCSSSCSPQRHDLRFWRHAFWVRLFAHQPRQLNCHSHKIIEIMMNLTFAKLVFDCGALPSRLTFSCVRDGAGWNLEAQSLRMLCSRRVAHGAFQPWWATGLIISGHRS